MGCEFVGWCALEPNAQAAWLQAIGSLLAVTAAVIVPLMIDWGRTKSRKEANLRQARGLALDLSADLRKWRDQFSAPVPNGPRATDWPFTIFMTAGDHIVPPKSITDAIPQLHLLGEAGDDIQIAIFHYRELHREHDTLAAAFSGGDQSLHALDRLASARSRWATIDSRIGDSIRKLAKLFPER